MPLPQENARLVEIAGGGASGDYRDDAADQPPKWQGNVGAYYRERRRRSTTAEGEDLIVERQLIVETRALPPEIHEGDDLTWELEGEPASGEIQEIVKSTYAPAAAAGVETTRLILEPA